MRIRYQMVGEAWVAKCDLSETKAKEIYNDLKKDGFCKWAEMVGEDDDNYMEVIESFDHTERANDNFKKIESALSGIFKI